MPAATGIQGSSVRHASAPDDIIGRPDMPSIRRHCRGYRALGGTLLLFLLCASACLAQTDSSQLADLLGPLPEWKDLTDLQVTYSRSSNDPDAGGPSAFRVFYRAPDRVKAIMSGDGAFIAIGDAQGVRVYDPEYRVVLWIPGEYAPELPPGIRLGGPDGPFDHTRQSVALMLAAAQQEVAGIELLPDQQLAGRPCAVVRVGSHEAAAGSHEDSRLTFWVDREYGVPLGLITKDGEHIDTIRATQIGVNVGIEDSAFSLRLPPSLPVFRGPLDVDDTPLLRDFLDDPDSFSPTSPEVVGPEGPVAVHQPAFCPPAFSGPVWSTTQTNGEQDSAWRLQLVWLSMSGGVIQFTEGVGEVWDETLPTPTPSREAAIAVGGRPARRLEYDTPFTRIVICWEAEGRDYRLEGSEVSAADLLRMAESVQPVTPEQPD
jgi:outer membrane lipoprotein-sorting protein